MLLDGLLGGLAFTAPAHAEHHFGGDREQQQPAGDAERRERNFQRIEKPIADQRGADQDRSGNDAGAHRDAAASAARQAVGDGEEGRRQPDRVDHDKQRQQRRDRIIEQHFWVPVTDRAADCASIRRRGLAGAALRTVKDALNCRK